MQFGLQFTVVRPRSAGYAPPGYILLIGVIAAFQRFVHKNLDSMLTPDGESDDERIRRLLREVLDERPGEA